MEVAPQMVPVNNEEALGQREQQFAGSVVTRDARSEEEDRSGASEALELLEERGEKRGRSDGRK